MRFASITVMRLMRAFAAGWSEIHKFGPKLWRLARELFHEVMGFVFLSLTLFFIIGRQGLYRTYQNLDRDPDAMGQLILVAAFVIMFGGFGISSFRRAKRLSRGK